MDKNFLQKLLDKHQETQEVPTTKMASDWAYNLLEVLYPEVSEKRLTSLSEIETSIQQLKEELKSLLSNTKACNQGKNERIVDDFFAKLPFIFDLLNKDIKAAVDGDPAASSSFEVIRSYPGFFAVYIYRIAHLLHIHHVPYIPRILCEYAHSRTGIDIHPAAEIGQSFFIDHGTGVVIGETTQIGNFVKIYQGVTLGALSIDKNLQGIKRHPTVEDHVVIYSGATILGGDTVIGKGSIIGGNVWLTRSCAPGTKIYHNADNKVIEKVWVE